MSIAVAPGSSTAMVTDPPWARMGCLPRRLRQLCAGCRRSCRNQRKHVTSDELITGGCSLIFDLSPLLIGLGPFPLIGGSYWGGAGVAVGVAIVALIIWAAWNIYRSTNKAGSLRDPITFEQNVTIHRSSARVNIFAKRVSGRNHDRLSHVRLIRKDPA